MRSTAASRFEKIVNSPEFVADPYPTFREMRKEDPVMWSEAIGGCSRLCAAAFRRHSALATFP
jgi:cytochrome P450